MHALAGQAAAFQEALQPEFKAYQTQVLANAHALAKELMGNGFKLVSGGTDTHLMLINLGPEEEEAPLERRWKKPLTWLASLH